MHRCSLDQAKSHVFLQLCSSLDLSLVTLQLISFFPGDLFRNVTLSDRSSVTWKTAHRFSSLYINHKDFVQDVVAHHGAAW
jgi:hypothetical protein